MRVASAEHEAGQIAERIGDAPHQEHPDTPPPMRGDHEDIGNPPEGNAVMENSRETDLFTCGYVYDREARRGLVRSRLRVP